MAKCKFPGCEKELIGKEKYICKSCKDRIGSGIKSVGKVTLAVGVTIVSVIGAASKVLINKNGEE